MDTITSRTVFGNGDKREGTKDFRSKSEDELYAFGGNQSKEKIIEKNLDESGREAELPTTDLPPFKILRQNIIPVHKHGEKSRLPELVVEPKSAHSTGYKRNGSMVRKKRCSVEWSSFQLERESNFHRYGLINNQFWLYPQWREDVARTMEPAGRIRAYQYKRVNGNSRALEAWVNDQKDQSLQPSGFLLSQKVGGRIPHHKEHLQKQNLYSKDLLDPNG